MFDDSTHTLSDLVQVIAGIHKVPVIHRSFLGHYVTEVKGKDFKLQVFRHPETTVYCIDGRKVSVEEAYQAALTAL
jgi:hypothetical protein